MAVTIQELIRNKEDIGNKKKQRYEIETSAGAMIFQLPDAVLVAESLDMKTSFDANKNIVYNSVIEPNLRDGELQREFKCFEPTDIVEKIFLPGEITKIANELLNRAGFEKTPPVRKLADEIKN